MSMMVSFCAVLFLTRDEILNLIESVSEGFPTYSSLKNKVVTLPFKSKLVNDTISM